MPINKRIIFKLMRNLNLDYEELCYVFASIGVRMVPNYAKLSTSIKYLLDNLEGKQQQLLVNLINSDFEIWPHYIVSLETLEDVFDCWKFKCNNKETGKFLIDLANELQTAKNNSALNDFKDSFYK